MEIKGTTKKGGGKEEKGGGKEEKANLDNGYYHKDKELATCNPDTTELFNRSLMVSTGRRVF